VISVARPDDPNFTILSLAANALAELCESLVFVGGCTTGLLVTAVRAQAIRATQDVDVIVQVATAREYHAMESAVAAHGFAHDVSPDAPICRWVRAGLVLDLMPSEPGVLGFHNRWYPLAMETSERVRLPDGREIRLISPPVFIATKMEAFHGRGNNDYLASHDLEDIITVVDGRSELITETRRTSEPLRQYLGEQLRALLESNDFLDAIPGHLPGDGASQQRVPEVLRRLRELASVDRNASAPSPP
jgi:predicted nucleotidyltransferase